jgi:predicted transcriptional regulator
MNKEDAKELLELEDSALRLFLVLRTKLDRWNEVNASMEDLEELSGLSRSTLNRSLKVLTEKGFVSVDRTKRNFGMLHFNRYKLLRCVTNETSVVEIVKKEVSPRVTADTSTDSLNSLNKLITVNKLNTSYLVSSSAAETSKDKKMVNRWSEDDDSAGGFGRFEEEVPVAGKKIPKKPHTRHLRPQNEWTGADVAAEFAKRIYEKIPGIPNIVNAMELAILLNKNRKQFGVTAEQEMIILEQFFDDERNINRLKASPFKSHLRFVTAITQNLGKVKDELEYAKPAALDSNLPSKYLYASDGLKFDNTIAGRAAMARYETKLKGK